MICAYVKIPGINQESDRIVWAVAGILSDHTKSRYGVIETIRDITRVRTLEKELLKNQEELKESYRKLAECQHQLEESELKYRTLLDNCGDGIFLVQNSRYLFINSIFSAISGYSEEDLYDLDVYKIIVPDDQTPLCSFATDSINGTDHQKRYVGKIFTKSGEIKMVEFTFCIIEYKGKPAILGRVRKITDQVDVEHALFQAKKKLQLLSLVTRHDINNKLTSLQGSLYILRNEEMSVDSHEMLEIAFRSVKAIEQAISFTKLYQDIGLYKPVWIDVSHEFFMYTDLTTAHGIDLRINLPDQLEILVDRLFSKVCYNLIENAIRHGESVTTITVSSQKTPNSLTILVTDDGAGIASEEKKKIFLRGHGRNTGMGLFLSREILKITGIELSEIGTKGMGAVFALSVPYGGYRFRTVE